ncbi:hypothetical protein F4811DRAFT_561451 [Daldinia bambusicola]|nr:hypothetical protein F4811DRAFT_561451 [Daldinia bambusicola]
MPSESGKVYRLRNLPKHVDRQSAAELLSKHIQDTSPQDIRIASLACVVDSRVRVPTKTATLTFEKADLVTRFNNSKDREWTFKDPALESPLVLDNHFSGLTPLNEVASEIHQYDCIAISGLASHPFGSWQVHGRDKSFMWIRDELPQFHPTVRFILYGYDTKLYESTSFQRVTDLANSFVNVLQADGWTSPTAKPLLFLAHSLGGVLLKQAFLMLIRAGQQQASISNLIAGAIFFGVPSRGLDINDVFTMLGDQSNRDALVSEISMESDYLSRLERQFAGASLLRSMKMYWAYETKLTPTVTSVRNSYSRAGPGTVLSLQSTVGYNMRNRIIIRDQLTWDDKAILKSLRVPDQDLRMQQIDPAANSTFDWVYDNTSTGFSEWLQRGEGIFWISGKPGSGKSTMMKFIHNDPRTTEILHQWRARSREIMASFFFHHRGNHIQKSFEGLLRSIVSQILEAEPSLGTLHEDILHLAQLYKFANDTAIDYDIENIIRNVDIQPPSPQTQATSLKRRVYVLIMKHSPLLEDFRIAHPRHLTCDPESQEDMEHIIRNHQLSDEYESAVNAIIERHELRISIQDMILKEWSRPRLEDILLRICSQTLLDVDLVLVLDALDEYDGRPEFVSGFLKDLTRPTGFTRTKIRVLFSSRPWDVFQKEFENSPGFRIHEHTEGDIRRYCVSTIRSTSKEPGCLLQFVRRIVARSRGVFLWVKLVLHDLSRIMNDRSCPRDSVEARLRTALDSMPDELEEYYTTIIERIPPATRWDTYIVLESLLRYEGSMTLEILRLVVAYSTDRACPNPQLWQQCVTSHNTTPYEQFIRRVAGGLVDIASGYAQLMHQTVKEFIQTRQFRHLVLEHNHADILEENGHSFLAKYFFLSKGYAKYITDPTKRAPHRIDQKFLFHAYEAEKTTGVSMYDFFANLSVDDSSQWVASSLPLATYSGLRLYLEDAHKASPNVIANSDTLISSLVNGISNGSLNDAREIVKSLIAKGLVVERDLIGLGRMMCKIWSSWLLDNRRKHYSEVADELEEEMDLDGLIRSTILYRGANPNARDASGRSPLDYILARNSVHLSNPDYLYSLSIALIKHGGLLRETTADECTQIFKDYGFPAWELVRSTRPSRVRHR